MAWTITGQNLTMAEGDFGLQVPITFEGGTITANDEIRFILNDTVDGNNILTKSYTNIQNNKIFFEITEEETAKLPVGSYVYGLDWYQNGAFMDNVIPISSFKVIKKVKLL